MEIAEILVIIHGVHDSIDRALAELAWLVRYKF